jgi:hypothetical protein
VPLEYVGMAICFGCVVIMTLNAPTEETPDGEVSYSMVLGTIIGFLTSWIMATTYVMNRRIKALHFTVVCFWHAIIGMSIALIVNLVLKITSD